MRPVASQRRKRPPETNRSRMGTRHVPCLLWYDAAVGRWTQQDTLDAPLDPTNANRYMYAGGDPIRRLTVATSVYQLLALVTGEPERGWVSADVHHIQPYRPVRYRVAVEQQTGSWIVDEDGLVSSWDAARTLNWSARTARPVRSATHWTFPIDYPARFLTPRMLPIWGRPRTADRFQPITVRALRSGLVEAALAGPNESRGSVTLDVETCVVVDLAMDADRWQVDRSSLRRTVNPTLRMPQAGDEDAVVLPG